MEIIKIDKNGNKSDETISCKIKFIDSARFMASSLSNSVIIYWKEFIKLCAKIVLVFVNTNVSRVM